MRAVRSDDAVTTSFPSVLYRAVLIGPMWVIRSLTSCPSVVKIRALPSRQATSTASPEGLQEMLAASYADVAFSQTLSLVSTFHRLMAPPRVNVIRRLPTGFNTAEVTFVLCSSGRQIAVPVRASHTRAVPSRDAVASRSPLAL